MDQVILIQKIVIKKLYFTEITVNFSKPKNCSKNGF